MPSAEHEAIVELLAAGKRSTAQPSIEESRAGFEALINGLISLPDDVKCETLDAGGVAAEWVRARGAREDRVCLYLHGGGYVLGSPSTHRELVARISRQAGCRCLSLDYRLAPEHPFPAAVEDATAAYRWLLGQGVPAERIVIAGDSAGGGLTLATLLSLRDAGDPLPAGAVCLSPWTDLEGTGASVASVGDRDPMITAEGALAMAQVYRGSADVRNPLVSPMHAGYAGLPPLLIQVGTREILLDDSTRVAEKARAAGVDVTLELGEDLIHVYQIFPELPEAQQAVERIAAFLRARVSDR